MAPTTSKQIRGGILHPNAAIQQEYLNPILTLVRRMGEDVKREIKRVYAESNFHAMDDDKGGGEGYGNIASQVRIAVNGLIDKYEPLFRRMAKRATKRMINRTVKNSAVTLGMSLKEMSKDISLSTDFIDGRIKEIVNASTAEAVGLIKLIPQKYLTEVQGAVSRSIATGTGLQELIPFLNEKYDQNLRHAKNVAMDQTRKVYSNVNAARMDALGVKKFEWVHTGGSQHPRKDHQELSGKVFSLDDLPVIGVMYGQEVKGKPGDLPYCRCTMRPLISFED